MSLHYADTKYSLENRKKFLNSLGVDYRSIVCAKQVHASQVRLVNKNDAGRGALSYDTAIPDTDSLVTNEKNLPLAVFTADCLSVFLYDSQRNCIGLIHAGWRSTKENILSKALEMMKNEFNTLAKDVYAGFGPAIRNCCYEVKDEFKDIFPSDLIDRNGSLFLDLVKINKRQLLDCGLKEANIFDSGICTSCHNEDCFSFRKEKGSCGRMMSVMMLK
jgi:hypothetical protein